jgi:hypothetical protein
VHHGTHIQSYYEGVGEGSALGGSKGSGLHAMEARVHGDDKAKLKYSQPL